MKKSDIPKIGVIFLAGGKGTRFSSSLLKQFVTLKNKPLALHSLDIFLQNPKIIEIVIVCEKEYKKMFPQDDRISFAQPGPLRQDSVFSGFNKLSSTIEWIYTHDAVRPFITQNMISQLYHEGQKFGAATFASPINYTIKKVSSNGLITNSLDRTTILASHTPQLLNRQIFEVSIKKVKQEQLLITDDVSLAEIIHHPVKVILSNNNNIKITSPVDLKLAELLYDELQKI